MIFDELFQKNEERAEFIRKLLYKSPYYPNTIRGELDGGYNLSTLVRICRGGKWYIIHHIEASSITSIDTTKLMDRIATAAHKCQYLYKLTGIEGCGEHLDPLQISEAERLIEAEQGKMLSPPWTNLNPKELK